MIISASRRTDIPAFYMEWLVNRLRAGFCDVPNPFNPRQISRVALTPDAVTAMVFWTRNPAPFLPYLDELDAAGLRYYVQVTLMDNPRVLDPGVPRVDEAVAAFRALSARIGPERVVWRYDPVLFSDITSPAFHRGTFARLATALRGATRRCVVSFYDDYRNAGARLKKLGINARVAGEDEVRGLAAELAAVAGGQGLPLQACAEKFDLSPQGVRPGKCIDDALLYELFGIVAPPKKDPSQRGACGCVRSRDIGVYGTCTHGCAYCYATHNPVLAARRRRCHDPAAAAL